MGKLVQGVGINDSPKNYIVSKSPYYKVWANMLKRCYCSKYHETQPSYRGTKICEEWLSFSNFKYWMEKQDWKGKCLDKDLLSSSKLYSPETCVFLSKKLNNLLIHDRKRSSLSLPQGVSMKAGRGVYRARLYADGYCKLLGHFITAKEAELVYNKAKVLYIERLAEEEDLRVSKGLLDYAKIKFPLS